MPPKLWNETVESHRRDVRDAICDAAAALVAKHGLAAVTMSELATESGIGRATLYKYFKSVEQVFEAWHDRQVEDHLAKLLAARDQAKTPRAQLAAILETYARIAHEEHGSELVVLMSKRAHVAEGYARFAVILRELIAEGARAGELRDDVAPGELASFCISAGGAASAASSAAAARRVAAVTLDALSVRPKR